MTRMTRRDLLKVGAVAGVAGAFPNFAISGTKSSGRILGANEAVRVGVAGINGQGNSHIRAYLGLPDVRIAYLIDPDSRLHEKRSKPIEEKSGTAPKCVQDPREALEDKSLDAISIATPNHWHSLLAIWGCQAGKDVYVEKPISHNVSEGRKVVEAARKHNRLVQHGTQNRSNLSKAREIAAVQSGQYGKLLVSKGYCCKPRWSIDRKPTEAPPKELAFDVWLGPASEQPYHENLVHYNWHWFWDFGNGDIGNQGVHEIDIARWAIKDATHPKRVWGLGGRFGYEDQGQTPNTQMCVYEYDDALLVFEVRGLVDKHPDFPRRVGNEFYTTEGRIADGKFYPKDGGQAEPIAKNDATVAPGGAWGSFINAVRSRDPKDLNAESEVGHYSAALCHLGNISCRMGESVPFNGKTKTFGDNKLVYQTFMNLEENLRGVGVKLEETTYMLGKTLDFDAETERFVGENADAANAFLTRNYRKPYAIPEEV